MKSSITWLSWGVFPACLQHNASCHEHDLLLEASFRPIHVRSFKLFQGTNCSDLSFQRWKGELCVWRRQQTQSATAWVQGRRVSQFFSGSGEPEAEVHYCWFWSAAWVSHGSKCPTSQNERKNTVLWWVHSSLVITDVMRALITLKWFVLENCLLGLVDIKAICTNCESEILYLKWCLLKLCYFSNECHSAGVCCYRAPFPHVFCL